MAVGTTKQDFLTLWALLIERRSETSQHQNNTDNHSGVKLPKHSLGWPVKEEKIQHGENTECCRAEFRGKLKSKLGLLGDGLKTDDASCPDI